MGIVRGPIFWGDSCPGGNNPRWKLSEGELSGWQVFQVAYARGQLSRGELSCSQKGHRKNKLIHAVPKANLLNVPQTIQPTKYIYERPLYEEICSKTWYRWNFFEKTE